VAAYSVAPYSVAAYSVAPYSVAAYSGAPYSVGRTRWRDTGIFVRRRVVLVLVVLVGGSGAISPRRASAGIS
jgi:hypothetical protein